MKRVSATILSVALLCSTALAEHGITHSQILLGQSCALKGPAKALGQGMKTGLNAYFDKVNANGGINGRKITLKTINDEYETKKCELATATLVKHVKVFSLIGGVGTSTAKVAVPIAEEHETPFIAPFTGAEFLRNPWNKWVVNVRGSFYQEMERLAQHLVDQKGWNKIACFYQNDGNGRAGLRGIELALQRRGLQLVSTGTYERNTVAVANGLEQVADGEPQAIIMVGAYKSCAAFIRAAKKHLTTKDATFCNISFVGTKALLNELGSDGDGCIVSQVVPFPWDTSVPVVAEFHADMKKAGKVDDIGFIALEGYLAGNLFTQIFEQIDGEPTREKFLAKLQEIGTFELGGITLQFGANDHQGMDEVFLTVFQDGNVVPLR